jgi:hypothetical protein
MKNVNLIETSFDDISEAEPFLPASNDFVNTVLEAYNMHYHLVIRLEDVWFSILVQLNVYINAHAEELRSMFVAHSGQKKIILYPATHPISGNGAFGVDWAEVLYEMIKEAKEHMVDPSLREWFMPAFITTTKVDQSTASIVCVSRNNSLLW